MAEIDVHLKKIEEDVFKLEDMISVTEAMAVSGFTRPTIISWCRKYHIGMQLHPKGYYYVDPKKLSLLIGNVRDAKFFK